jgi:para-aminobenzoate synthetase/4-amino-4-deoxychorismate lyase
VVSVSPERFFWIADSRIVTRPMKGTRRRGRWPEEDAVHREELRLSEKDRAENVMIVDLMRNDLGRVAQFGSVSVDELFTVERYPTVWQMTSEVSARLREDVGLFDVFAALFPCGSVTGAPKARSMEIIAEVEAHARGVYCGAVGVLPPGDGRDGASFQVAIRTAVVEDGVATYGVGGGVTWDSTVDDEYGEALAKALVLTRSPAVDGLFETIRWDDDWVWLDAHLARLQSSAGYWALAVSADELRQKLDAVAKSLKEPTRVRLTASATGRVEVDVTPAPGRFEVGPVSDMAPVSVAIDSEPVDSGEPRLFHKTTDRAAYDSRLGRHPDVEDVLLVNERGLVTESTIANVVFRFGNLWVTPPVEDGLLPGVMRAHLLAEGSVVEESVSVERAAEADAVALVNSVRGWRPAVLRQPLAG